MKKQTIELFVSASGNDAATGTINDPLRTFSGAKNKVKQLRNEAKLPITVYFRGGEYKSGDNAVVFTADDSGSADAPVTYCAYNDEKVYFTGGKELDLSTAEKVNDVEIKSIILDDSARAGLYKLDVSDIIDELPKAETAYDQYTHVLYRNNMPMRFARWPHKIEKDVYSSDDRWLFTQHVIHGDPVQTTPFKVCMDYSTTEHIKNCWSDRTKKNAWLHGYLFHNWTYGNYPAIGFDFDNCKATFDVNGGLHYRCDVEHDFKYRRYYFYNILEEINDHSEFCIDYENKLLYYYPESPSDRIILNGDSATAIEFQNASYITVSGFSFTYYGSHVIVGKGGHHIIVENCTISRGNGEAMVFSGCSDLNILNNHIYYMGCQGIIANGAGNYKTLTPGNILIEGNHIHEVSLLKRCGSCAINIWSSVGTTIRKNKLHDSPNMLIFVDGLDTIIEYNEIYRAVRDTDDAAAIYWGRTANTIGTKIRYNYFHDNGQNNTSTWAISSIYTDDLATSGEVYGNLFINAAIFGDDNNYMQNPHSNNNTFYLNSAQFAYAHDNIFLMSTIRETPMSDIGPYSTRDWLKGTLGAYIPGNNETRGRAMQWREELSNIGFFEEDGLTPNKLWEEHYKNTHIADMFRLLSAENYIAGATDENGNTYGIPDIRKKFENGEVDVKGVNELFDAYIKQLVSEKFGKEYVTNCFERNIVIGVNDKFLDENGVIAFENMPHRNNVYITEDEARLYFEDMDNIDYAFTEAGKKKFGSIIPDMDYLKNASQTK